MRKVRTFCLSRTCRDKCQRELGGSDLSEKRATESIPPSLLGKGEKVV